ncbi:CIC11C00000000747 [Sungouiella intermedia]|uniref:Glutaredoxin-like protein n=1 Tax=Sungouiella intermedia TaxID=45354 RepID=A0A1L0DAK0_9ASCO|nr:CIC11C00000000747 [[Candida] intermedia]SGZ58339.1 CIC11C00000004591 [[Candida] intermedia]
MYATLIRRLSATSSRLVSLTFFTKETCQLCKNAHAILEKTLDKDGFRNIPVKVVDIMKPENSDAFDKYCYDVPVLHVDRPGQRKPIKFMHYFDESKLAEEFGRE